MSITAITYDEESGELDTLIEVEVEVDGLEAGRPIDVHIGPRTSDVRTVSLNAEEAWRLARELARCAASVESAR